MSDVFNEQQGGHQNTHQNGVRTNLYSLSAFVDSRRKQLQGGLDKIWILPYVEYSRRDFTIVKNVLKLYPNTTAYQYDVNTSSYEQTLEEDPRAGLYYRQKLSFTISGVQNSSELWKLTRKRFRVIVKDRLGTYRMLGLFNGVETTSKTSTGANKTDMNGYSMECDAMESDDISYMAEACFLRDITVVQGTQTPCF